MWICVCVYRGYGKSTVYKILSRLDNNQMLCSSCIVVLQRLYGREGKWEIGGVRW